MPLVGEHQAEDRQLIADMVLAKMNELVEKEANAPKRPTTIQPSQVQQHTGTAVRSSSVVLVLFLFMFLNMVSGMYYKILKKNSCYNFSPINCWISKFLKKKILFLGDRPEGRDYWWTHQERCWAPASRLSAVHSWL